MKPLSDLEKAVKGQERFLILEVGNYNTKLVEAVPQAGRIITTNGFIFATPEGTIEDDVVVKHDELVKILKEKITEEKITSRFLTISLSSKDIITREMNVPKMNKKDTLSFIKMNSKDLFPVDLADYTLGYVSIETLEVPKLMIIAIPNDIIAPYVEIASKLNLVIKSINFSGFELYNIVNFELGKTAGSYAVIDIGSKNTNFIITSKGMLMYNRVIKNGSDDITQAIADNMKCTLTKGEKIKREYNSVIIEGSLNPNDEVYIVANIIRDVIGEILSDISNLIEFYNTNHSSVPVEKVYIIGLASKISGICEFVESTLGIPTEKIREFERVVFDEKASKLKARQVTLENCFGALPLDNKKVCLMKSNLKISNVYQTINPEVYKWAVAIGCLAILGLVSINFLTYKIKEKTNQYTAQIDQYAEVEVLQRRVNTKKSQLKDLQKTYNSITEGAEQGVDLLTIVDQIAQKYSGVTISNYNITKSDQITIMCFCEDEVTTYDFMDGLREKFDGVPNVVSSVRGTTKFSLTLK